MPSGFSDAKVGVILDKIAGASADNTIMGATMYLHAYTTAPSDDNGTGRVDWGQGSVSVATVNGTNWPAAAGRSKTSAQFTVGTNSTGSPIVVVAFGWETAASSGTYLAGSPVSGGSITVPAGAPLLFTLTLAAPSPS